MLKQIFELGKLVLAATDIERVLELSMDYAIEISAAERGMIILFDVKGDIQFESARNLNKEDIENPPFEISRTIINDVMSGGEPICIANVLDDPKFQSSRSATRLKILSVICLPLIHENEIFGVVYLDNRSFKGAFGTETMNFVQDFADFISLAAYNSLKKKELVTRVHALEDELRTQYDFNTIVGNSNKMIKVLEAVSQVADTNVPVLIEGESGTGKELIAKAIHINSSRRECPLITLNCGALPDNLLESELFGHEKGAFTGAFKKYKGKFELADGGTIFLDEMDEMSSAMQVKLLRILQWGEFNPLGSEETKTCDVRIIATSKTNLQDLVKKGKFREDLYYRLNIFRIKVPPLRERKEDILPLVKHFLQTIIPESKSLPVLSKSVEKVLANYEYPGNVRELENVLKHAGILCNADTIELDHLPSELTELKFDEDETVSSLTFKEAKKEIVEKFERQYLQNILDECGGVINEAAKRAGMYEKNFHDKLNKYSIRVSRQKKSDNL